MKKRVKILFGALLAVFVAVLTFVAPGIKTHAQGVSVDNEKNAITSINIEPGRESFLEISFNLSKKENKWPVVHVLFKQDLNITETAPTGGIQYYFDNELLFTANYGHEEFDIWALYPANPDEHGSEIRALLLGFDPSGTATSGVAKVKLNFEPGAAPSDLTSGVYTRDNIFVAIDYDGIDTHFLPYYKELYADVVSPVLDSNVYTYVVNVNHLVTPKQIMNAIKLTATDDVDGNLNESIHWKFYSRSESGYSSTLTADEEVFLKAEIEKLERSWFESNGIPYTDSGIDSSILPRYYLESDINGDLKLGNYYLPFIVSDKAGNKAILNLVVTVQDLTAPEFTESVSRLEVKYSEYDEKVTAEHLSTLFKAEDNYSKTVDITFDLSTVSKTIGEHTVRVTATDESNNITNFSLKIVVYDDIPPVIVYESLKLDKSYTVNLSVAQIVKQLAIKATDNIDGDVKLAIENDTYTGKENKVGVYTFDVVAKDNAGNVTRQTVSVRVFDDVAPVFFVSETTLIITTKNRLTPVTLANVLRSSNRIDFDPVKVEAIEDTYTGNHEKPGTYAVTLRLTNGEGEKQDVKTTIRNVESVEGDELDNGKTVGKITQFFKTHWKKIVIILASVIGGFAIIGIIIGVAGRNNRRRYRW